MLQAEHTDRYDAVDYLDDASTAVFSTATQTWRDGVRRILDESGEHMLKEDFRLFPAALATVEGADWDAMDQWGRDQRARLLNIVTSIVGRHRGALNGHTLLVSTPTQPLDLVAVVVAVGCIRFSAPTSAVMR